MTFLEFMEKLNELYVGNERDLGYKKVMVAADGVARDFSELVVCPDEIVLCYKASGGLSNDR